MTQDQFTVVPETTLPSGQVVPEFEVSTFACTHCAAGDKAAPIATAAPWTNIRYQEAIDVCQRAGYKLITETQWLALAYNASQQDANWTKGKVGEGKLYRGIRKGLVSSGQPGNYLSEDKKERRWLVLSNGERVCDINGNIYQWVFDDVQGDAQGLPGKIAADSISLTTAPYPSQKKGMGWRPDGARDWSGNALVRGGCWYSGSYAGVFCLSVARPDRRNVGVGFRCTR